LNGLDCATGLAISPLRAGAIVATAVPIFMGLDHSRSGRLEPSEDAYMTD
jgi:hypothetical protein